MKYRFIATTIVLLFVGVAVAPSINTSIAKASTNDDLIEVTNQACGIKGYGDTTVKLTRKQYQQLEEYLVEFRARLNQTTTREEAIPIFKEAVVELDKYGLLPRGMSVELAQRLVITPYDKRLRVFDSLDLDPDANYFCLVAGKTSVTGSVGGRTSLIMWLIQILMRINNPLINVLAHLSWDFFCPIFKIRSFFNIFLPFGLLCTLIFGSWAFYPFDGGSVWSPSEGWVSTIGVNGKKTYEGTFFGFTKIKVRRWILGGYSLFYPGALGFTGLKLGLDDTFFLGTAFKVKLISSS